MSVVLIIIGFAAIIFLIAIHEFGHFVVARRNGVVAEEYGIFFPPRIFKKRIKSKKGDWDFSIGLLPLGGFVKLKGEHDSDTEKGSFGAASLWAKTKIMAAGVAINFVIALILLTILALTGLPKLLPNQFTIKSDTQVIKSEILVNYVEPHSPAANAGMKVSDQVVALGPAGHVVKLKDYRQLEGLTQKYAGQKVNLVYENNGEKVNKTVQLRSNKVVNASEKTKHPKGHLGVELAPNNFVLQRSTWSAPIVAFGVTGQIIKDTIFGIGKALGGLGGIIGSWFTGNHAARSSAEYQAGHQVAGPIGLYFILKSAGILGFNYLVFIIALISLTLALVNFLPFPAIDGRVWILIFSRAIKKPLTARAEELMNAAGFLVLIGFFVLIVLSDYNNFIIH